MLAGRFGTPGGVPVAVVPPTLLAGTRQVGQVVTVDPGQWVGNFSLAYQWFRDAATVIGTNSPSYTLVAGDATHTVKCRVTATNNIGSASQTTADTTTIAA